ncbi:F-box/kelch-repeat protein [Actinidia chinensis var. chinensis]|uniref:F-box/kelch-repeat protein n=1 Tax=Actinidia chinensis var. chinensis TaxID=1590841 RepID=A0A2R6S1Z0_ACTCC|nr:F-box/kelch-repeat protein [Actinidia chinensis var. chinensis]
MFTEFTELIPGLPEELAFECLTRLHFTTHRVASGVCRRWRDLLHSRDFYYHRKRTGFTRKAACLVHSFPAQSESKPVGPPSYGLSVFDPVSGVWDRVDPVPKYPEGFPLFCQVVSSEGKVVVMGGWDPASWDPVRDVFVFEFTTRRWTQRQDMPSKRSFFAACAVDGRVYVAGGHDESKNALSSAWVYDIRSDEWTELTRMSEERDECEGVVIGSEFWVVSGYGTESQGGFKSSAESLDLRSGQWSLVEGAWGPSQCPRSCAGVGKDGNLVCWAELDPAVRFGSCGVDLGDQTLVTGSEYQGAPHGFYLVDKKEGQNGKLVKIEVPDEFSGFVQSGCCIEI